MTQHRIDKKGRLAVPLAAWEQIGILAGQEAELFQENGQIIIRRRMHCRFCGGLDRVDPEMQVCYYCDRLNRLQFRFRNPLPG